MKRLRRTVSIALVLVLLLGIMPAMTIVADAATVPQSAVDDFVQVAKAAKDKTHTSLGLPTTGWCGYFVEYCLDNSQIRGLLGDASPGTYAQDPIVFALKKGSGSFSVLATAAPVKPYKNTYYNKFVNWVGSSSNIVKVDSFKPVPGDLVLFNWNADENTYPSHIGIMISENRLIHGNFGSSKVVETSLDILGVDTNGDDDYDDAIRNYVIGYFRFNTNGAPIITAQPHPVSAPVGKPVTLSVTATGTPAPTYQWQMRNYGETEWQDIPGATASSYTINVSSAHTAYYRCKVSNDAGTVYSDGPMVGIMDFDDRYEKVLGILKEKYSQYPQIANGFAGFWAEDKYAPVTLTPFATAPGDSQNAANKTVSIDGVTYSTSAGIDYVYAAKYAAKKLLGFELEGAYGVKYDYAGELDDPSWKASIGDVWDIMDYGTVLSLTDGARNYHSIMVLCKFNDDKDFFYLDVDYDDAGSIRLGIGSKYGLEQISYGYQTVISYRDPYLELIDPVYTADVFQSAPRITAQPRNDEVYEDQAAEFTVEATGNPAPTYQWQRWTEESQTWTDIAGANTATYRIDTVDWSMHTMQVRCKVSNLVGTVYTEPASLYIMPIVVENLTVLTPPKLSYLEGESLDLSDLRIKATYSDGTSKIITNDEAELKLSVDHGAELNYDTHNGHTLIATCIVKQIVVGTLTVQRRYEIKELTLADNQGQPLTEVPTGEFYARASVRKQVDCADGTVVLAAYTDEGKLVDIRFLVAEVPAGTNYAIGAWFANSDGNIGMLKAYIVSSLNNMEPLCPAKEIS